MSGRLIGLFISAHVLAVGALYAIAWSIGGDPAQESLRFDSYGAEAPAAQRPASNDLSLRHQPDQAGS